MRRGQLFGRGKVTRIIHGEIRRSALLGIVALLAACGEPAPETQSQSPPPEATNVRAARPAMVDGARIRNADREPGQWLSHGRTYGEQRYSPLDAINEANVGRLGIAWYFDLDTKRGQEATPLVVDGVMYVSTAWSKVKALDAKTGELIWQFDPEVTPEMAFKGCCDVVNRGVAVWNGKVYVGTFDGRLIALDAATGQPVWRVVTVDVDQPYTITGAPRVVKGKVLIGNGGAEYNVRGYVSAYDAETGDLAWRFYTVPGDPSKGFESPALEMAAKTWNGEWWTLSGGGGTVWDAMAYDPELDLLYIGTGNGGPFDRNARSPGGGDNLFLSSIVALKPDTGEYVWHFQTTPGDSWDFTAVQHMILADLTIDGRVRKVLMQAPKNGFFYVLDRVTGEFISAKPYIPLNWATGVDEKGRPIMNPDAWYMDTGRPVLVNPGPPGAHNWQPMAFNPNTGLVYIPAQETPFVFSSAPPRAASENAAVGASESSLVRGTRGAPGIPEIPPWDGYLLAWDPVAQREVWRVDYAGAGNGGVLATAGNLVVQGTAHGELVVYRADNGQKLWSMPLQTGVMAGPISYTVDGEQYIAVAAGWGGAFALVSGEEAQRSGKKRNISRVIAFKVGGAVNLPPEPPWPTLNPPPLTADAQTVARGGEVYQGICGRCHGLNAVSGGTITDLRYSAHLAADSWFDIVLGGAFRANGMVSFADTLTRDDAAAIRAFLIAKAHEAKAAEGGG
jgi:PQQ-dependent dehydrogenase (methanol/ethanol family)